MKRSVRNITFIALMIVLCALLLAPAFAANSEGVVFAAQLSEDALPYSDAEQTVSVTLTMDPEHLIDSAEYRVVSTIPGFAVSEPENMPDGIGTFDTDTKAFAWMANENVTADSLGTYTVTIPAGTKAGAYTIGFEKIMLSESFSYWEEDGEASAVLTISSPVIDVDAITLDMTELELKVGETQLLQVAVSPVNATDYTVSWESSNEAVATVRNGVVTAVAAGETNITVRAGVAEATCAVTVLGNEPPIIVDDPVQVEEITLDRTELSLTEGESETLSAVVNPEDATDRTVSWSSSNSDVATVRGGVVTAVAEGEAVITARAGNVEATCIVIVAKAVPPYVEISGLTLNQTALELKEGETATLTATIMPEDATEQEVKWNSSNTAVATVSDGVISAASEGSAVITASAGAQQALCAVTVIANVSGGSGDGPVGPGGGSETIEYGLRESEIAGYVTISFEDYGVRLQKDIENGDIKEEYLNPLGIIVSARKVPFKSGDTIADVTVRLLDELGWGYDFTGKINKNFYLASIQNFSIRGNTYSSFGEFDAGKKSGWMITWNDWFIDASTAAFQVKDGDVVRWQYTCQLGADIGDPFYEDNEPGAGGAGTGGGSGNDNGGSSDQTVEEEKPDENGTTEEEQPVTARFEDVAEDAWYAEPVRWAVENRITNGVSETAFAPNESCTRAQIVTFLWRAAGSPKVEADNPFTDVTEGAWYYDAVLWAVKKGVTTGVTETRFAPNETCTRAQAVTFLWRAAGKPAVSGTLSFTDVVPESWYGPAVKWAADHGITVGIGDGLFGVTQTCTRAEIVTFLYRNR